MKVKELIELLKKCNQNKEVIYVSYSEMIDMSISGVVDTDEKVTIEE